MFVHKRRVCVCGGCVDEPDACFGAGDMPSRKLVGIVQGHPPEFYSFICLIEKLPSLWESKASLPPRGIDTYGYNIAVFFVRHTCLHAEDPSYACCRSVFWSKPSKEKPVCLCSI